MANYTAGTVAFTEGSTLVTGTGTRFRSNVKAGQRIAFAGLNLPYQIAQVVDDVTLRLTKPVSITGIPGTELTLTEQSYSVIDSFTPNLSVPILRKDDVDKQPRFVRGWAIIDQAVATVLGWEIKNDKDARDRAGD